MDANGNRGWKMVIYVIYYGTIRRKITLSKPIQVGPVFDATCWCVCFFSAEVDGTMLYGQVFFWKLKDKPLLCCVKGTHFPQISPILFFSLQVMSFPGVSFAFRFVVVSWGRASGGGYTAKDLLHWSEHQSTEASNMEWKDSISVLSRCQARGLSSAHEASNTAHDIPKLLTETWGKTLFGSTS